MSATAAASGRGFGRSAGTLSTGVGVAGLLTYVFFSLASHNLDAAAYGEIVVLWSAVFVTISVLHRPVEQFISRSVAEHGARREPIGGTLRAAATVQAGVAVLFLAVVLVARGPLEDDLFSGESTIYWVYVTSVLCFAVSSFARGYLAGRGGFGLLAGLLVCESVARTAFALAVAVGIASGQDAIALGIVFGPLIALSILPFAFRHGVAGGGAAGQPAPASEGAQFTLAEGGGFAAAVLLIMFSEQTFMNAGPLLLNASEGAAAAGFIFNVMMIARAPLVIFQAVATSLLPHLTRLLSRGPGDGERTFRLSVRGTVLVIAGLAATVGLAMLVAGPQIMQIAFGDKFTYDRAGLLIVTAGMGFYLSAATLNQAALAQGQVRRAATCWIGCAAGFIAFNLLPILDAYRRVEVGFAVAAMVLCGLLYLLYRRPHSRSDDIPAPGSPQELEARLAAADEAG
jgi:O-antigen/teichoic acid export membrane protein